MMADERNPYGRDFQSADPADNPYGRPENMVAPPKNSVGKTIRDVALDLVGGASDIGKQAYGVGNLLSGGQLDPATRKIGSLASQAITPVMNYFTGQNVEATPEEAAPTIAQGFQSNDQALSGVHSDYRQLREQQRSTAIQNADGVLNETGAAISETLGNPSLLLGDVARSAPSMFAPAMAGRKVASVMGAEVAEEAAKRALAGGATREAAQEAGQQAVDKLTGNVVTGVTGIGQVGGGANIDTINAIHATPQAAIEQNPEYQSLTAQGMTSQQARDELARKAGLLAAAVAAPLSMAASKMTGAAEQLGKVARGRYGEHGWRQLGIAMGKEAAQEYPESFGEQYGQGLGQQRYGDTTTDPTKGAYSAAALGALAGGVMGAGEHVAGWALHRGTPQASSEQGGQAPAQEQQPDGAVSPVAPSATPSGPAGLAPEPGAVPPAPAPAPVDAAPLPPDAGPLARAASLAPSAPAANGPQFPFSDRNGAQKQADRLSVEQGIPYEVADHPQQPGRFTAVPVALNTDEPAFLKQAKKLHLNPLTAQLVGAGEDGPALFDAMRAYYSEVPLQQWRKPQERAAMAAQFINHEVQQLGQLLDATPTPVQAYVARQVGVKAAAEMFTMSDIEQSLPVNAIVPDAATTQRLGLDGLTVGDALTTLTSRADTKLAQLKEAGHGSVGAGVPSADQRAAGRNGAVPLGDAGRAGPVDGGTAATSGAGPNRLAGQPGPAGGQPGAAGAVDDADHIAAALQREGGWETPAGPATAEEEELAAAVDAQAHQAAASPHNDRKPPSDGQITANNYKTGPIDPALLHGLRVAIENPSGSTRTSKDPANPWQTTMADHYGRFTGTEGADGDPIDAFVGPNPASQKVFVVDQTDPASGNFDEHKVMLGYNSLDEAKAAYARNYPADWQGGQFVTETNVDEFKGWLRDFDTTDAFNPAHFPARAPGVAAPAAPVGKERAPAGTFNDEVTAAYSGQTNHTLTVKDADGTPQGTLEYSDYQGVPAISMIDVPEGSRRQGYATQLVQELQRQYPDTEIEWGMQTGEGAALRQSLPQRQEATEHAPAFERLAAARQERDERKAALDALHAKSNMSDDDRAEAARLAKPLNGLHDEIHDLEYALLNKRPSKTLMGEAPTTEQQAASGVPEATAGESPSAPAATARQAVFRSGRTVPLDGKMPSDAELAKIKADEGLNKEEVGELLTVMYEEALDRGHDTPALTEQIRRDQRLTKEQVRQLLPEAKPAQEVPSASAQAAKAPEGKRARLKAIAERLGIAVQESKSGFRSAQGEVAIPAEDAQVEGAVSPDHVFAHELGHAVLAKRHLSFKGFPKKEMLRYAPNWDELVAASKAFRPAVWNHADARVRRHAGKAEEVLADAIGSVLLGEQPLDLLKPFMGKGRLTVYDLGLEDAPLKQPAATQATDQPGAEPEVKPPPKENADAIADPDKYAFKGALPQSLLVKRAVDFLGSEAKFLQLVRQEFLDHAAGGYPVLPSERNTMVDEVADNILAGVFTDKPAHYWEHPEFDTLPELEGKEFPRKTNLFPAPEATISMQKRLADTPLLTQEEANAQVAAWKAEALRIGREQDNSKKVVISLYDRTGIMSQPYEDAGYTVFRYDMERGDNLLKDFPIADITNLQESGHEIVGVIAQPPCTSFAVSGAHSWAKQHDIGGDAGRKWVEKKYGAWASLYFDKPIEVAEFLVLTAQTVVEFANPSQFYVLENPIGRIADITGLPAPTMRVQPHQFGNAYTKNTQLWGEFNTDLPTAPVSPKVEDGGEGSRIADKLRGSSAEQKQERSVTPEGLAYAFFMANHGASAAQVEAVTAAQPVASVATTEQAPVVAEAPQEETELSAPVLGKEVERFAGKYGKGMAEANAKMWAANRAKENPQYDYTVEEASEQYGASRFVVVQREKAPIEKAKPGLAKMQDAKARAEQATPSTVRTPLDRERREVHVGDTVRSLDTGKIAEVSKIAENAEGHPVLYYREHDGDRVLGKPHRTELVTAAAAATEPAPPAAPVAPTTDRQAIAQRYATALQREGVSDAVKDFHLRFADDLLAKDAFALKWITNGMNDKSKKVFTEITGVPLPRAQGASWEALKAWAGVTPEQEAAVVAKADAERAAKQQERDDQEAEDAASAQRFRVSDTDASIITGKAAIDQRIADGFTAIKNISSTPIPRYVLAHPERGQYYPLDKIGRKYAELALRRLGQSGQAQQADADTLTSVEQAAAVQADHERELADAKAKGQTMASDEDVAHLFGKKSSAQAKKADNETVATTETDHGQDNAGDQGAQALGEPPAAEDAGTEGGRGVRAGDPGRRTPGAGGNRQPDSAGVAGTRSGRSGAEPVHSAPTGAGGRLGVAGAGRQGTQVPEDDAGVRGRVSPVAPTVPGLNFHITSSLRLGRGGETEKFNDNLAAIRTLKAIEADNRRATPEEQAMLARYVGWGGLAAAFPNPETGAYRDGWAQRGADLEALLSSKEYSLARRSTLDSHYTSETVVSSMWQAAQRLGYQGGLALESSVGVGNFLGLMPEALAARTRFVGVEYDSLTARIAGLLYPQETILHSGFQDVPLPDGQFDLAIGNPPFGEQHLRFQFKPELNRFSIHNQFFLGALDAVKPGGLQIQVVSRYLLDAQDPSARIELAKRAKLLGAIRLPDTAFKENARTSVVTDIVFLQRLSAAEEATMEQAFEARYGKAAKTADKERERRELAALVPDWINVARVPDPLGGEVIPANAYFRTHPQMVLGTLERSGKMNFKNDITVRPDESRPLDAQLADAIDRLPQNVVVQEPNAVDIALERYATLADGLHIALAGHEAGSIRLHNDGSLQQVIERETPDGQFELTRRTLTSASPWSAQLQMDSNGQWYKTEVMVDGEGKKLKLVINGKATKRNQYQRTVFASEAQVPSSLLLGKAKYERLRQMVALRDLLVNQLNLEAEDAPSKQIAANRSALAKAYNAFVSEHGLISEPSNAALLSDMPDGALVQALESGYRPAISAKKAAITGDAERQATAKPAAILSKRVIVKYVPPTSAASLADAIAIQTAESGQVDLARIAQLLDKSEAAVQAELEGAEHPLLFLDPEQQRWVTRDDYLSGTVKRKLAAAQAAGLSKNASELESVLPEQWGAENVSALLGSAWVPPAVYQDFVRHITGSPAQVVFSRATNAFTVGAGPLDRAKEEEWGSDGISAADLISDTLNSRAIKVMSWNADGKPVVDEERTKLALLKARAINNEFADWVFADSDRRKLLVETFNDKFNTRTQRQHDGSHLYLPGKVPDAVIRMRRHQKNAIWRGIVERFLLLDHAVGAGKTFTAIARAMERRRMGLAKKPMIAVPNHMVEQFTADAYRLYPGAKVLAAGKKDFERSRRRKLFAKIATGDYDIIIVPHSSFGFIGIAPETELRYLEQELQVAEDAIIEAQQAADEDGQSSGRRKPFGVKEAERLRDKITARMASVKGDKQKDKLLTFEQMGVDDLTVDEAHEFKNLFYSSRLTNIKGMGNKSGSQKAFDLYNKVRVLRESPKGAVTFMTGTPISNSAVEMYTMMRYLAADDLRELGLEHFDAWRAQYVSTDAAWEPTETGRLKEVNRLGRTWSNMRSLMDLYYGFTDAVSNDDIKKAYREDNDGAEFPIPRVKGGDRQSVVIQPTPAQIALLNDIMSGFDSLPNISDPYERNIKRLRLMDRARKVSLDVRAVDPLNQSKEAGGKLEKIADEVTRLYQAWHADLGTQLVFLDRSVPKAKGDDKLLREYDALLEEQEQALRVDDEATLRRVGEALEKFDADAMDAMRGAQAGGWNAYQQLKDNLIARGIPANEIRFVQEANNDEQKQALFDAVNDGRVRVLIGSTARMGAGTNVQERLVGLHHADVTWKPSDIEQREGRIIRQGNSLLEKYGIGNFEVEILAYATERTIDAKMWNLNATKLRTINGIRNYDGAFSMEFEDADSVSMAELAALASGDPMLLERVKLMADIDRLELLKRQHAKKQWGVVSQIEDAERDIARMPEQIAAYQRDINTLEQGWDALDAQVAARTVEVEGQEYGSTKEALDAARKAMEAQQAGDDKAKFSVKVGAKRATSMNGIKDAIDAGLGERLQAEVNGDTLIQRVDLQRVAGNRATELAKDLEKGQQESVILGTMLGMPLELSVFRSKHFDTYGAGLALLRPDGSTLVSADTTDGNSSDFNTARMSLPLASLDAQAKPAAINYSIHNAERRLAAAQAALPDLLPKRGIPFAEQGELDTKMARLEEVIRLLAAKPSMTSSADASLSQQLRAAELAHARLAAPRQPPVAGMVAQPSVPYGTAQTQTDAFRRWFGKSLVVDHNDAPQVMYHASKRDVPWFNRMKSSEWRRASMDTVGSWFSDTPAEDGGAGMYVGGEGAAIYPVYLAIQRPKVYDAFNDFLRDMHAAEGRRIEDQAAPGLGSAEGLRERLKAQGYDGIAFTKTDTQELHDELAASLDSLQQAKNDEYSVKAADREPYTWKRQRIQERVDRLRQELKENGGSTEFDKQYVWVAFEPEQIKSAIGNNGQFDPANPSIVAEPEIPYGSEPGEPGYNDPYEHTETRPGTTPAQLAAGRSAVADLVRRIGAYHYLGRDYAHRGQATILGQSLLNGFIAGRPNQLRGQTVSSPGDLAALAQVYRDPRFETFRVVFLKGKTVVGENAYSARLPAAVNFPETYQSEIAADKAAFGADGYYLMHNHPSGSAKPSVEDRSMTMSVAEAVPGFQGHVIIDHNQYGVIDAHGQPDIIKDWTLKGVDYRGNPPVPHALLGQELGGPQDVANFAKALQTPDGHATLVLTTGNKVGLMVDVPMAALMDTTAKGIMKGRAMMRALSRAAGTSGLRFIVLPDGADAAVMQKWLRADVFTDVVTAGGLSLHQLYKIGGSDLYRDAGKIARRVGEESTPYGGKPADVARRAGAVVKSMTYTKVANALVDKRGMGLPLLGRRQLVDIYGKDFPNENGGPNILQEHNALTERMDAEINDAGAKADALAVRWGKVKDNKALADVMHDATLMGFDPRPNKPPAQNLTTQQMRDLRDRYNALSEEAKKIFVDAARDYTTHYNAVRLAIRARIIRALPDHPRRAELLRKMDSEMFGQLPGIYFPLARFGDYVIRVQGPDGSVSVSRAETLSEAEALQRALRTEYDGQPGHTVMPIIRSKEFNAARDAVGRGFLQELYGAVEASDKDNAPDLLDAINQLYLNSLPNMSWAKHGIHRKGTPGFAQDARRAYAHNMFHGARYLARLHFADRLTDRLDAMQAYVDEHASDPKFDQVKAQQVVDEMVKRHDIYMNPKTHPFANFLTSAGFVFYLGLSPASAAVNLSQTALVAYPILGGKYGFGKAGGALLRASKDTMSGHNDMGKVLSGDELAAYNHWVKIGLIDVSMAHDLAGIAQGQDGPTNRYLSMAMKAASFMFHHAERFNRQATALAAYRLAREKGMDHQAAMDAATEDTYAGHFDYSQGNRARIMQGNVARVLLLFKQYAQNMIYTFARNFAKMVQGDRQAMKVFSGLLVTHALAAGVLGLPLVTTLLAWASALGGDDDEPWDAQVALRNLFADAFGDKMGEVMSHGLSRLTPWDISSRVGLDHLLLPDVQEGLEGQRWAESWMASALGPVAGIGVSWAKAGQDFSNGSYQRALEEFVPAAVRGPLRSFRYFNEGVQDRTGIDILPETNAAEIAGQALGLAPSRAREAQEGKSAIYRADKQLQERRQTLMNQFAHAQMEQEDTGPALEAIQAFNMLHPNRQIAALHLQQSVRARMRRLAEAEQGVFLPKTRSDARAAGAFANPSD